MHPGVFAQQTPGKPAYIMASDGRAVTYRELDQASNRCARLFRFLGLRFGDAIAILMENHPRYLEVCWAAQRSGLYYTCISTQLTAEEAAYIIDDCGAKLFVTSAAKAGLASALADRIPAVKHRFMAGGRAPGYEFYEEAVAGHPAVPIPDEVEGADMLYSSGTTGRPKGVRVRLTGEPLGTPTALSPLMTELYKAGPDSVYLSPAPLYHSAPLRFNMRMQRLGATCVIMDRFDPERALQLIEKYKITHSQWVPTMFVRMLKLPEEVRRRYDLSSMRVAIHAAAPCPVEVKERMIEWWGPVLYEYYAGTEGNGLTAITSQEWLTHRGSVGKPYVGVPHILDDDGKEVPTGESGTIYFEGGREFEYYNDPRKTAESRNERGWTTLWDMGYVDPEGYLYLTDRKAFMIISGGVNIYPQEIENLLVTHPKVMDAAVFGVPNEEFGEEVKAVVQPVDVAEAGPELADELLDFCRLHLSHVKCPRSIDFEAELPRHPNGKLYKRLLRDRYWGNRTSRIV